MKIYAIMLISLLCVPFACCENISIDMDISETGASVNIDSDMDAGEKTEVKTSSTIKEETDDYKIGYVQTSNGSTSFKIIEPKGAYARIYTEQRTKIHNAEIPTSFSVQGNKYYIIEISKDGKKYKGKFEAKKGMAATLCVKTIGQIAANVSVNVNVSEKAPVSDCEMGSDDFDELVSLIKAEDFSDDQMDILDTAVKGHCFNIDQAIQLIKLFEYEDDKITAAKKLYPALNDQSKIYKLNSCFEYSSSKEEFKEWVDEQ